MALLSLDADQFHHMRRVMKGDVPQTLMRELNARLENTHFQALTSILRIASGYGRPQAQEVTVGLLAEEMNLDPSRASRIAADLVERGLVARAVSQEDGRRSVLVTTEAARTLLDGVHAGEMAAHDEPVRHLVRGRYRHLFWVVRSLCRWHARAVSAAGLTGCAEADGAILRTYAEQCFPLRPSRANLTAMSGWDESEAFEAAVPLSQRAVAAPPAALSGRSEPRATRGGRGAGRPGADAGGGGHGQDQGADRADRASAGDGPGAAE